MRAADIVYESGAYFVVRCAKGFEIYLQGAVAAVRCAQCGYTGQKGLKWYKAEIARRLKQK